MKTIPVMLVFAVFTLAAAEEPGVVPEQPIQCLETGICVGTAGLEVIEELGEPDEKGEAVFWGATGEWGQDWFYGENALTLTMFSTEETGSQVVGQIQIEGDCQQKTIHGIGIGSTREEVAAAYGSVMDGEFTTEDFFVAGSIYGGVGIYFENDAAVRIFAGPMAE